MAFRRASTSESTKSRKFDYRPRTAEEVEKRATQSGYDNAKIIKNEFQSWTPTEGTNRIRILPPSTREGYGPHKHFGCDLWVHYSIGADRSAFLCLDKHGDGPCPIDEERKELFESGEADQAKELAPRKRVGMWIIDRKQEGKGPLFWSAPWMLDQEISKQSINEDGANLAIDDPYEGYDVYFDREDNKGGFPNYKGVKVARKSSPIFDDEEEMGAVLEFIVEHPIPDCLEVKEYDYIRKIFSGASTQDEDKPKGKRRSTKDEEPEEEKPRRSWGKSSKAEKDEEPEESSSDVPSWADIHEMDDDELGKIADENNIDFGDKEFDTLTDAQDFVCEELGIEKPERRRPTVGARTSKPSTSKPSIRKGNSSHKEDDEGSDDDKGKSNTAMWRNKLSSMRRR